LRRPVPSASALVIYQGHVLLVRRGREPEVNSWSLPAGLIELGETAEEAARRETLEETGIKIEIQRLLGVYNLIGPGYHYIVICFRATPLSTTVRPGPDVEDACWHDLKALKELRLMSVTRKALRDAGLLPQPSC